VVVFFSVSGLFEYDEHPRQTHACDYAYHERKPIPCFDWGHRGWVLAVVEDFAVGTVTGVYVFPIPADLAATVAADTVLEEVFDCGID
jgi:hypothetical protein